MAEEEKEDRKEDVISFENHIMPVFTISRLSTDEAYDEDAPEGLAYRLLVHLKFHPYLLKFKYNTSELRDGKKKQLLKLLYKTSWKEVIND